MKTRSAAKPPKSSTSHATNKQSTRSPMKPLSGKPVALQRLSVLYNELKLRDSRSRYPWRILAFGAVVCSFLSMTHIVVSAIWSAFPATALMVPGSQLYQRYDAMFYNDSDFAYIPESSMMITTTAKAGSTTFWTWLHRGITGLPSFDKCKDTYIQNFAAPCWLGKVVHPFNMTDAERWRMVNRPEVLRVAVTRDPYERLISAWKSKAACDSDDFGTDVHDRDLIVPILLRQAHMRKASTCLSLTSFAQVLEKLRIMSTRGDFNMHDMNKHFRPQECYFNDIKYDIILDVQDLTNATALEPIIRRLKDAEQLHGPPRKLHVSTPSLQMISEQTAALLYRFAKLSESFPA